VAHTRRVTEYTGVTCPAPGTTTTSSSIITAKFTIIRDSNTPPNTDYSGWYDKCTVLDLRLPRKAIHLADWNGDRFGDVIVTDKATGVLDVFHM
jgi:hypothetical protein